MRKIPPAPGEMQKFSFHYISTHSQLIPLRPGEAEDTWVCDASEVKEDDQWQEGKENKGADRSGATQVENQITRKPYSGSPTLVMKLFAMSR